MPSAVQQKARVGTVDRMAGCLAWHQVGGNAIFRQFFSGDL